LLGNELEDEKEKNQKLNKKIENILNDLKQSVDANQKLEESIEVLKFSFEEKKKNMANSCSKNS